jgi:hypothetical protein
MAYKSRIISLDAYFEILQKEYICTLIRKHIYPYKHDTNHFEKVMKKKEAKIRNISEKEGIGSIFNDTKVYIDLYMSIVSNYGFPKFIYNERIQPDEVKKKYRFPYSGTLVYVEDKDRVGLTDYFDFDKRVVFVRFDEGTVSQPYEHNVVHRLNLEQADRFYYYSDGEFLKDGINKIMKSTNYDHKSGIVELYDGENLYSSDGTDIRRIIHVEIN